MRYGRILGEKGDGGGVGKRLCEWALWEYGVCPMMLCLRNVLKGEVVCMYGNVLKLYVLLLRDDLEKTYTTLERSLRAVCVGFENSIC